MDVTEINKNINYKIKHFLWMETDLIREIINHLVREKRSLIVLCLEVEENKKNGGLPRCGWLHSTKYQPFRGSPDK